MIDLTKHPDAARVLRNAVEPNINPAGTWILYHQGDYSDQVGLTAVGRAAYDLAMHGKVALFQKIVSEEPRVYGYWAVVR